AAAFEQLESRVSELEALLSESRANNAILASQVKALAQENATLRQSSMYLPVDVKPSQEHVKVDGNNQRPLDHVQHVMTPTTPQESDQEALIARRGSNESQKYWNTVF
ncbi:hypothetical protein HDU98_001787, partial [Podochytrium sp. JEL0797]